MLLNETQNLFFFVLKVELGEQGTSPKMTNSRFIFIEDNKIGLKD